MKVKTALTMQVVLILLILGLISGFVSGLVGIGGSTLIVPVLVFFLGMNQHTAQGTTLSMFLLPIGILGFYNYYKAGYVDLKVTAIIASTFVVGSFMGSKLAIGMDQTLLRRIFGLLLMGIAAKIFLGK